MKSILLIFLGVIMSFNTFAVPSKLEINTKIKPKSSERYIKAVHKEIETSGANLEAIKYAILEGMLTTKGYKWLFEGEGDGYVLARFDYRGDTNVMRIEYDKDLIQLKYHKAWGDYECEKLVDDICYKNSRGYYNYIKNLRKSIARQVSQL